MGTGRHVVAIARDTPEGAQLEQRVSELRHELQVILAEREYATLDTIAAELIERGWHR